MKVPLHRPKTRSKAVPALSSGDTSKRVTTFGGFHDKAGTALLRAFAALLPFAATALAWGQTAPSQETKANPPDAPALISQLSSPYVRLRDEAETALKSLPDALPQLRTLVQSAPASEAGLRAAHIVDALKGTQWALTAELQVRDPSSTSSHSSSEPPEFLMLRALCPAPDHRRCVALFRGGAAVFTLNPLAQEKVTGQPSVKNSQNWQGLRRALAVSPDGQWIASGNERGEILLNDFSGEAVRKIAPIPTASASSSTSSDPSVSESPYSADPSPILTNPSSTQPSPGGISLSDDTIRLSLDDPPAATSAGKSPRTYLPSAIPLSGASTTNSPSAAVPDAAIFWGFAFSPDNKRLISLNGTNGLTAHDLQSGTRQSLPLTDLLPRCLALSADGQYAAIGADPHRQTCRLFLVKLADRSIILDTTVKTIPNGVSLNPDGSQVLIAVNNGSIMSLSRDGTGSRQLHQFAAPATSVSFSTDGRHALATSLDPQAPVVLINTETGNIDWTAPAAAQGSHSAAWIDSQHFATSTHDGFIRLWSQRGAPALPQAE